MATPAATNTIKRANIDSSFYLWLILIFWVIVANFALFHFSNFTIQLKSINLAAKLTLLSKDGAFTFTTTTIINF